MAPCDATDNVRGKMRLVIPAEKNVYQSPAW